MESLIFFGFDFSHYARLFSHLNLPILSSISTINVPNTSSFNCFDRRSYQFAQSVFCASESNHHLSLFLNSNSHNHIFVHPFANNFLIDGIYELALTSSTELYLLSKLPLTNLYSFYNPIECCFLPLPGPYTFPDSTTLNSIHQSIRALNHTFYSSHYSLSSQQNSLSIIVIDVKSLFDIDQYKYYLPRDFCVNTYISGLLDSTHKIYYYLDSSADITRLEYSSILQKYALNLPSLAFDDLSLIHNLPSSNVAILCFNPSYFHNYLLSSIPVITPTSSIFIDHPFFMYARSPHFVLNNLIPSSSDFLSLPRTVTHSLLLDPYLRYTIPLNFFTHSSIISFVDLFFLLIDYIIYPE